MGAEEQHAVTIERHTEPHMGFGAEVYQWPVEYTLRGVMVPNDTEPLFCTFRV